jgi:hypothetical protein
MGLEPAAPASSRPSFLQCFRYGEIGCGGIVETHWDGGVRGGGAGTCVGLPGARTSSAAREQFPPGIVHQLEVRGYAAVYDVGSCAETQLLKLFSRDVRT